MRALAVAAFVFIAGCSGAGSQSESDAGALTGSPGGALNSTLHNNTSATAKFDHLYFLKAPAVSLSLPDNQTVLATQAGQTPQSFTWNRTANGTGNITGGRLSMWLLLPRSAAQSGANNDPACTLRWTATVVFNGTTRNMDGGCGSLGMGPLAPGTYAFNISAAPLVAPIPVGPGADIRIQITSGFVVPNGQGYLMGGGKDFDSYARLDGLQEIMPNDWELATDASP